MTAFGLIFCAGCGGSSQLSAGERPPDDKMELLENKKMAPPPKDYPILAKSVQQCGGASRAKGDRSKRNGPVKRSSPSGRRSVLRVYSKNKSLEKGDEAFMQTGIPGPAALNGPAALKKHSGRRSRWKEVSIEGCEEYQFISLQCKAKADSENEISCLPSSDKAFSIQSNRRERGQRGQNRRNQALDPEDRQTLTLSKASVRILDEGKGFLISLRFAPEGKGSSAACRWSMEYRCGR